MRSIRYLFIVALFTIGLVFTFASVSAQSNDKIYLTNEMNFSPAPDSLIEMINIDGGKFLMGNLKESDLEKPVHEVFVPSFMIAKTELTYGQLFKDLGLTQNSEDLFYALLGYSEEDLIQKKPKFINIFRMNIGNRIGFISQPPASKDITYNLYVSLSSNTVQKIGTSHVVDNLNQSTYYFNEVAFDITTKNIDINKMVDSGKIFIQEKTAEEFITNHINEAENASTLAYILNYLFSDNKQESITDKDTISYMKNLRARYFKIADYLVDSKLVPQTNKAMARMGTSKLIKLTTFPVTATWTQSIILCNLLSDQYGFDKVYTIESDQSGKINSIIADNTKNGYRLPTEAEWEFAARGGINNDNFRFSGSDKSSEIAFFNEPLAIIPYPIKLKKANSLGIYDMSGNVGEWTWDLFDNYSQEEATNPMGPATPTKKYGNNHIIRGGSWVNSESFVSVSKRTMTKYINNNGLRQVGIRLVRTISQ